MSYTVSTNIMPKLSARKFPASISPQEKISAFMYLIAHIEPISKTIKQFGMIAKVIFNFSEYEVPKINIKSAKAKI